MELSRIPQEDEYVSLAAMHYSIQFGPACSREQVQQAVEESLSTQLIQSRGMTTWIELICSAHLQVGFSFLRLQLQVGAAQVTSVWDHHAGSREEERGCERRAGQQRPADVALGLLQVL